MIGNTIACRERRTIRRTSVAHTTPRRNLRRAGIAVAVALAFFFAVRLLGAATEALEPLVRRTLRRTLATDRSALGLSWLASYAIANGSVVAAISLSLFGSGLIDAAELFTMLVGSRLGGSGVVVLIGALDYVNEETESLQDAVSLGLLTFLLAHSVFWPATAIGLPLVPLVSQGANRVIPAVELQAPTVIATVTGGVVDRFGPGVAFILALTIIYGCLQAFDRLLERADQERLRRRYITLVASRWVAFAIGWVVTMATMSVAFSLGVVVPLYNRGHIRRSEVVPFVLGANVGTFADTLLIALTLNTSIGIAIVLLVATVAGALSILVLGADRWYTDAISGVQRRLLERRAAFWGFLVVLAFAPVGLLVV